MKIIDIYQKYFVPENLQKHMLRVAAVAEEIMREWNGPEVDRVIVREACMLHDIAKPMTFDPEKQVKFGMGEEEIEKLRNYQTKMRRLTDGSEHAVARLICDEIGVSEKVKEVISVMEWIDVPKLMEEEKIESVILAYADMSVGLKGVLPIHERIAELRDRASFVGSEVMDEIADKLEEQMSKWTRTDLKLISDERIAANIMMLGETEIGKLA